MVLARQLQYALAIFASGLGFWDDLASGSSTKSAGITERSRNLGWYEQYRNSPSASSATSSQSNFCFLNSIQNLVTRAPPFVVVLTATAAGTLFDASDPHGSNARAHQVAATTMPIAESGIGTIKAPTRLPYVIAAMRLEIIDGESRKGAVSAFEARVPRDGV